MSLISRLPSPPGGSTVQPTLSSQRTSRNLRNFRLKLGFPLTHHLITEHGLSSQTATIVFWSKGGLQTFCHYKDILVFYTLYCPCLYDIGLPYFSYINHKLSVFLGWVMGYWGLTPQQQPGSYQGGEMMMKSVFWWRKPEYPEETTVFFLSVTGWLINTAVNEFN